MNRLIDKIFRKSELIMEIKWILNIKKLAKIKLLVFDIDGVLTNGKLLINDNGDISREFNARDGMGIKLLLENNIIVAFISGAQGEGTLKRAEMLGIKNCFINIDNKNLALKELQKKLNILPSHTAFIGDDINDLVVRENVSLLIAPKDASYQFTTKADLILKSSGGMGVAREISDRILI
tara:strand:+ start:1552 stop:2091 length:540 start_codon:yes stop_codon:yes gene_type:complete